jgi:hypothetical protein
MTMARRPTANMPMLGATPTPCGPEGGTPSECGLRSLARTQGGARRQRADPGLWGATALRLAGGEDRRGDPAIGTSGFDLLHWSDVLALAVTPVADGARGMEHRDQNQRVHARRACVRLPVENQGPRPRDPCR